MYMLFAVRDLGLSPTAAGVIAGCGGLGSLAGSMLAEPALRRFGAKATLVAGFALGGALQGLVPLAHGTALRAGLFLLTAQIVGDGFMTIAFVNDVSLRQLLVPDRLHRRIDEMAGLIRATIATESDFLLAKFNQSVSEKPVEHSDNSQGANRPAHQLKRFITRRAVSVRQQLDEKSKGIILQRPERK
jgi:hypothetical protein